MSPYVIPNNITNPSSSTGLSFLILNNEFRNDTYLSGFDLYGALAGKINISVKNFNITYSREKFIAQ